MTDPTDPTDPTGTPGPGEPQNPYAPRPEHTEPPAFPRAPAYGEQPVGQAPGYPAAPAYPAAPGYPAAPAYPGAAYGTIPGTEANSLGVWALVLGIVGFVCAGFLTGVPAIIVGNRSRRAAAEGRANNGGMGTAGMALGWVTTVLSILGFAVMGFLIATLGWDEFVKAFQDGYHYP